ncbi:type I glutamate--ammonia ligase [Candidatus Pacearchaeota archaeon]|nr:MAG: type I glutamate--ammonia ligase [Candidatus Pacearchaeota archaeon]
MKKENKPSVSKIFKMIKKKDVKFVKLQFTDILGTVKSVMISVDNFSESIEKGTWFDGSSIEGFARICESDMFLKPDISTFAILPWRPKEKAVGRVICDVYNTKSKPFKGDPRFILKKILKKAWDEFGFIYNTGPEIEFFLFKKKETEENGEFLPVPHDIGSYFDFSPLDLASNVRRDIIFALEKFGIKSETSHHEVAPGQHEIDIKYDEALNMADKSVTFKYTVKAISSAHGLYASFMPKPIFGINGSGMHVHQSLFDKKGKNVFFNKKDKYKLSDIAYSFIAGQLEHIKAMSAILNPIVNSYKRLVPGYEAPVYICWGQVNRSALIRIPRYSKGREKSTRAELRSPDPSCNPYLAFAVMLAAGLDGIERNLSPPEPVEEDVYNFNDEKLKSLGIDTLPESLDEAIKELKKDKVIRDAIGDHIYKFFLKAKKSEWKEYSTQVTKWELRRYLEYT